ncbi:MAG: hypothetical protein QFF03_00520 [Pseudomonadota bacterium]|nr:hypothetical protein [Pseudomonadota bacterium]
MALLVIGLLGIGAYPLVVRAPHPALMDSDLFHGLWLGVCLGLELTGVYMLRKRRRG